MPAVAAVYALGAIALAIGLVGLLHFLEPEYDPAWHMLSEYSLGRYGGLMRVAFIAAGTSVIAIAVALPGSAWPWDLGLAIVAIGPLGAAFIDTDPITMPRAAMSRRSNVHAALGSLFILGFPVAATVAGLAVTGDAADGLVLAWLSAVPWVALAWFLGSTIRYAQPDGVGSPLVRIGWPNRVSMLAYLGWVATAAVLVLRP